MRSNTMTSSMCGVWGNMSTGMACGRHQTSAGGWAAARQEKVRTNSSTLPPEQKPSVQCQKFWAILTAHQKQQNIHRVFFLGFERTVYRIPCRALRVALVPCHSLTLTGRKGIPEVDLETGVHRTLASTGRDLVGLHDTYTCVREHELCVFFNRVYAGRFGELRTSRRAAPDGHRQAPSSVQRTEQQARLALL